MTDKRKKKNKVEGVEKPYESIQDWIDDISYLKWPLIIIGILIFVLIMLIQLNIF